MSDSEKRLPSAPAPDERVLDEDGEARWERLAARAHPVSQRYPSEIGKRTSAKITPEALRHLGTLPAQVQSRFGVPATQEAIVSALVLEITVSQLAGILMGYHQEHPPRPPADEDEP